MIGPPLRSRDAASQQITPVEGLSALSLDALTSVAYGPEAILAVLAVAGSGELHVMLPITIAIVALLAILVFSYRQVIDAYPGGGGSYAVSRENFGPKAAQLAAASLIVDYTLTVSVSISAGVQALTSAYPGLTSATIPICLGILALITVLNLRGLGESARAFLLPTMLFIVGMFGIIIVGLVHPLASHLREPGGTIVATHGLETVGILLVLKAFSAGCSALTGVEAIANGVPLFKQPRAKRAKRTEVMLGTILGAMLLGLAVLALRFHIEPRGANGPSVLAQTMGAAVGRHLAFYAVSLSVTVVLALAANTSFGGLPILASLLARDNHLPHAFGLRGDRLVYSYGVWTLAVMAGVLLVAVKGNTQALIPLFAIGVFIGFTMSQSGLVVHWWRQRPPRWRYRATVNATGAVVTGIATVIFLVTKFLNGAWVVVIAVPSFIYLFHRIGRYYERTGEQLGIGSVPSAPAGKRTTVVVPTTRVSELTSHALSEALSIGQEVIAVTVVFDEPAGSEAGGAPKPTRAGEVAGTEIYSDHPDDDLQGEWRQWNPGVPLRILHTEYASVVGPLLRFIDDLRTTRDDQIVVLIPVVIPRKFRYRILHNQMDLALSAALRTRTDVVVARVPMSLESLRAP